MTKKEMHEELVRRMDETSTAVLEFISSGDRTEDEEEFYNKQFENTGKLLGLMHNYVLEQLPTTSGNIAWWVYVLGNLTRVLETTLKEDEKFVLESLRGFCRGAEGQMIRVEVPGGEFNE